LRWARSTSARLPSMCPRAFRPIKPPSALRTPTALRCAWTSAPASTGRPAGSPGPSARSIRLPANCRKTPSLASSRPTTAPVAAKATSPTACCPKTGLATGTAISASASVVFDLNAALATNTYTKPIDASPAIQQRAAVASPGEHARLPRHLVRYGTTTPARRPARASPPTTSTCPTTAGRSPGGKRTSRTRRQPMTAGRSPLCFYSLATDNVGQRQTAPAAPATTLVAAHVWHNYANRTTWTAWAASSRWTCCSSSLHQRPSRQQHATRAACCGTALLRC